MNLQSLPVLIVDENVKFHLFQNMTDQFIAVNASNTINHEIQMIKDVIIIQIILEKINIMNLQSLPVLIVDENVKFHLFQNMTDQFIAVNASNTINHEVQMIKDVIISGIRMIKDVIISGIRMIKDVIVPGIRMIKDVIISGIRMIQRRDNSRISE